MAVRCAIDSFAIGCPWQRESRPEFAVFTQLLRQLSPDQDDLLEPGKPTRLRPDDVLDYPTLRTSYGEIPATQCSEAVRRILGLGYLITWAWTEHQNAARLREWSAPFPRMVVLFDEIEAHLHPRWQRTILPSLLDAVELNSGVSIQLIGVTHAPLLLASMEPLFDEARDRLFVIDLMRENDSAKIGIARQNFRRHGDATAWLTSEVFDLPAAVSIPAEHALKEASGLMAAGANPTSAEYADVDRKLRKLLAAEDVFLLRWRHFGERRGLVG